MKERGLIRIIILLSGALLWVAYLFDAVCSRYAIYEVIGYGAVSYTHLTLPTSDLV